MSYSGQIPDTAVRRLDWQERSACRTEDPELFFDGGREHEARTACAVRCPVRAQCLEHVKHVELGMHHDHRDGVLAGLTGFERYRLDATASRRKDDAPPLVLDGTEECGTYAAMVRHLWLGERVDGVCWSGEVRRHRENRIRQARRPAGEAEPEPLGQPPSPQLVAAQPPAPQPVAQAPRPRGRTPKERHVYALWCTGLIDLEIARRADLSSLAVRRIRDALGLIPNKPARKAS
ncbi:WhiB family transcriptional regulator [Streptomyces sp. NPDC005708]|uniref:WhiB family transcriptional regulator n=1 Tax=Streptomyces sp. NPDC005708 TaxID=3154564 RepID=UPI0033D183C4